MDRIVVSLLVTSIIGLAVAQVNQTLKNDSIPANSSIGARYLLRDKIINTTNQFRTQVLKNGTLLKEKITILEIIDIETNVPDDENYVASRIVYTVHKFYTSLKMLPEDRVKTFRGMLVRLIVRFTKWIEHNKALSKQFRDTLKYYKRLASDVLKKRANLPKKVLKYYFFALLRALEKLPHVRSRTLCIPCVSKIVDKVIEKNKDFNKKCDYTKTINTIMHKVFENEKNHTFVASIKPNVEKAVDMYDINKKEKVKDKLFNMIIRTLSLLGYRLKYWEEISRNPQTHSNELEFINDYLNDNYNKKTQHISKQTSAFEDSDNDSYKEEKYQKQQSSSKVTNNNEKQEIHRKKMVSGESKNDDSNKHKKHEKEQISSKAQLPVTNNDKKQEKTKSKVVVINETAQKLPIKNDQKKQSANKAPLPVTNNVDNKHSARINVINFKPHKHARSNHLEKLKYITHILIEILEREKTKAKLHHIYPKDLIDLLRANKDHSKIKEDIIELYKKYDENKPKSKHQHFHMKEVKDRKNKNLANDFENDLLDTIFHDKHQVKLTKTEEQNMNDLLKSKDFGTLRFVTQDHIKQLLQELGYNSTIGVCCEKEKYCLEEAERLQNNLSLIVSLQNFNKYKNGKLYKIKFATNMIHNRTNVVVPLYKEYDAAYDTNHHIEKDLPKVLSDKISLYQTIVKYLDFIKKIRNDKPAICLKKRKIWFNANPLKPNTILFRQNQKDLGYLISLSEPNLLVDASIRTYVKVKDPNKSLLKVTEALEPYINRGDPLPGKAEKYKTRLSLEFITKKKQNVKVTMKMADTKVHTHCYKFEVSVTGEFQVHGMIVPVGGSGKDCKADPWTIEHIYVRDFDVYAQPSEDLSQCRVGTIIHS